ncbi:SpoVR family protein [Piscibacillus salipiscarius]|nr:SpoVR family protein [Piscibacillus salipiscarius]
MTQENLIPYMEHEGFGLFINVFRQLATTCSDLNSNFVAPINYFLMQDQNLCDWQTKLLRMIYDEAFYFNSIKKTTLLNEGYAVLRQTEYINLLNLSVSEKLEIAQIDARLHYKPEQGLNYYSLGRSMWEEVLKQDVSKVLEEYTDVQF